MLRDLTKQHWLDSLNISADLIPQVLLLRGTRNLKGQYAHYRELFDDVREVGTPNGLVEDVLIGSLDGCRVGYASVYGGPMASEVTHLFGVIGTRLVIQIGCCGALADGMGPGDLICADEAFCGDGASQYYLPNVSTVRATLNAGDLHRLRPVGADCIGGRVFSTAALFAESRQDIEDWCQRGYAAVDMETAATFAVAQYFGMERMSLLFAFDNPRHSGHLLLDETDKAERRTAGNARMTELALEVIRAWHTGFFQR